MASFRADMEQARRDRTPVMALRPRHDFTGEMDDIVVKNVTMFRAEAMDEDHWWMACYFANGEQVTFWVGIDSKPKRIVVSVAEHPPEWNDLDSLPHSAPEWTD